MNLTINSGSLTSSKLFLNTPEQSLRDMIETPLGSRIMRPYYGSEFYRLIDKTLNDVWVLQAKKAILQCTKHGVTAELWDERVDIETLSISLHNGEAEIEVTLC